MMHGPAQIFEDRTVDNNLTVRRWLKLAPKLKLYCGNVFKQSLVTVDDK